MKRPFRVLGGLMCLLFCFSATACEKIDLSGKKTDPSRKTETADNVLTVKTTVAGAFTFYPEAGISPQGDRVRALFAEAEREAGCTIDAEILSEATLSSAFLRACRAESKYADLIQTDALFLTERYRAGYLLPLEQAGVAASASGVLRDGETAYALRADGWNRPLPTASYLMFYNGALLEQAFLTDPAELYEANAWDWAHFKQLAEDVKRFSVDGDGFALAEPTLAEPTLIWATLYAAGADCYDGDTCVMDSAAARDAFAKIKELRGQGLLYRLLAEDSDTADETALLAFTNRRTAFLVGNTALLYQTDDASASAVLQEALRVIPFPEIAGGRSNTVAFTEQDIFCALPKYANAELCQTVLPLLFRAPEGTDPQADLIDAYFFDERDGVRYQELLRTAGTDTKLRFSGNLALVEGFLLQIFNGASAKEILGNLELIFNEQKGS